MTIHALSKCSTHRHAHHHRGILVITVCVNHAHDRVWNSNVHFHNEICANEDFVEFTRVCCHPQSRAFQACTACEIVHGEKRKEKEGEMCRNRSRSVLRDARDELLQHPIRSCEVTNYPFFNDRATYVRAWMGLDASPRPSLPPLRRILRENTLLLGKTCCYCCC